MSTWFWIIVGFVLGVFASGIIYFLLVDKFFVGNLREDRSIPEEPYYFMEISNGRADRLHENNFALMRVVRDNYIRGDVEKE